MVGFCLLYHPGMMLTRSFWRLFPWRLALVCLGCFTCLAVLLVRAQTRIAPDQIRAPRLAVLTCTKPASSGADCSGLYFVDLITPAGRELKIVGPAIADGVAINAADWSLVP